jgi:hypothetical protein
MDCFVNLLGPEKATLVLDSSRWEMGFCSWTVRQYLAGETLADSCSPFLVIVIFLSLVMTVQGNGGTMNIHHSRVDFTSIGWSPGSTQSGGGIVFHTFVSNIPQPVVSFVYFTTAAFSPVFSKTWSGTITLYDASHSEFLASLKGSNSHHIFFSCPTACRSVDCCFRWYTGWCQKLSS